jgi:ketosteroid isomerase-like protein
VEEHPNIRRAKEAIATFNRGDLEGYRQFFDSDVVWHVAGNHPLSGDYHGREALFEYFARVRELTGGTLQVSPEEYLADDDHLGIFTRVRGQRGTKSLDVVLAQAFRLNPSGQWSEYWAFADDQKAVDEFWSEDTSAWPSEPVRPASDQQASGAPPPPTTVTDMTQHPNALAMWDALDAFNQRDFGALAELLADDAIVHLSAPAPPMAYGKDEYLGMIDLADELSGGTQHVELETVLASDRYMMSFMRGTAESQGTIQDVIFVIGAKLNRAGKWAEMWYWIDDGRMAAA